MGTKSSNFGGMWHISYTFREIPKTIFWERCQTSHAPLFLNLRGRGPELLLQGLFPARYFRRQIHQHNQIFIKRGSLICFMWLYFTQSSQLPYISCCVLCFVSFISSMSTPPLTLPALLPHATLWTLWVCPPLSINFWQNLKTKKLAILNGAQTSWPHSWGNMNFSITVTDFTNLYWVTRKEYLSYILPTFVDFIPTILVLGTLNIIHGAQYIQNHNFYLFHLEICVQVKLNQSASTKSVSRIIYQLTQ